MEQKGRIYVSYDTGSEERAKLFEHLSPEDREKINSVVAADGCTELECPLYLKFDTIGFDKFLFQSLVSAKYLHESGEARRNLHNFYIPIPVCDDPRWLNLMPDTSNQMFSSVIRRHYAPGTKKVVRSNGETNVSKLEICRFIGSLISDTVKSIASGCVLSSKSPSEADKILLLIYLLWILKYHSKTLAKQQVCRTGDLYKYLLMYLTNDDKEEINKYVFMDWYEKLLSGVYCYQTFTDSYYFTGVFPGPTIHQIIQRPFRSMAVYTAGDVIYIKICRDLKMLLKTDLSMQFVSEYMATMMLHVMNFAHSTENIDIAGVFAVVCPQLRKTITIERVSEFLIQTVAKKTSLEQCFAILDGPFLDAPGISEYWDRFHMTGDPFEKMFDDENWTTSQQTQFLNALAGLLAVERRINNNEELLYVWTKYLNRIVGLCISNNRYSLRAITKILNFAASGGSSLRHCGGFLYGLKIPIRAKRYIVDVKRMSENYMQMYEIRDAKSSIESAQSLF